jgi:predicted RNA polymerase sigma factor
MVAVAVVDGPRVGLSLLGPPEGKLGGQHRFNAVRAHLLEQAGERAAAIADYEAAAELTTSLPERNYLLRQAARLRDDRERQGGPSRNT